MAIGGPGVNAPDAAGRRTIRRAFPRGGGGTSRPQSSFSSFLRVGSTAAAHSS